MKTHHWFWNLSVRLVLVGTFLVAATLIPAGNLSARTLFCADNPDYLTKRCTIHPYAVTKVVAGQIQKGHLVGCQFKSYTCMNGLCQDNYGPNQIPYFISMDALQGFCGLICNNPSCNDPQGWQ